MTNEPTLKDYARRMRTLVEGQAQYADDLRELAKEMRETGFQAAVLKAWVKAMISYESGDEGPIDRIKARTADVALYGGILGFAVEGFGEPNRIVVNHSQTMAPEAVAVPPGADSDSVAVSDSPVPLPDPTLDGEGAGGTDPFEVPPFLRRIS